MARLDQKYPQWTKPIAAVPVLGRQDFIEGKSVKKSGTRFTSADRPAVFHLRASITTTALRAATIAIMC
jgi:hypothetical protein